MAGGAEAVPRRCSRAGRAWRAALGLLLAAGLLAWVPSLHPAQEVYAALQPLLALQALLLFLGLWTRRGAAAFWAPGRARAAAAAAVLLLAGGPASLWLPAAFPTLAPEEETPREFGLLWWNLQVDAPDRSPQFRLLQESRDDLVLLGELPPGLPEDLSFLAGPRPRQLRTEVPSLAAWSRLGTREEEVLEVLPGRRVLHLKLVAHRRHVDLFVVHAPPPGTPEQLAFFRELAPRVAACPRAVVAGDLNAVPWSPVLRRFRREAGLRDGRRGRGLLPTWGPEGLPPLLPLDQVLLRGEIRLADLEILGAAGSDHRAIRARLRVHGPEQAPPRHRGGPPFPEGGGAARGAGG